MDDILDQLDADMKDEAPVDVEAVVGADAADGAAPDGAAPAPPAEPTPRSRADLEARARSMGVPFRANISDENLRKRVEDAEAAQLDLGITPTGNPPTGKPPTAPELVSAPALALAEVDERTAMEMAQGRMTLLRHAAGDRG